MEFAAAFHRLNEFVLAYGFHPFYFYAASLWLFLLAIRSLHWRRRRVMRCEVCDHRGPVRNEIRGTWRNEIVRFLVFVPPGFFLHMLMGIYAVYFVTRWFVIRHCAECESECLVPAPAPAGPSMRPVAGYLVMIGFAAALFLFIRSQGEQLPLPQAVAEAASRFHSLPGDAVWRVLLSLAAIIVAARGVGHGFKHLGQPAVVGEIVAGIALGPSLLGLAFPLARELLLPPDVAPFLGILANVGVVLFMFLVGVELDPAHLRGRTQATVTISHASMLLPFVLGSGLAYFLFEVYAPAGTPFTVFALFCGVALSVTAFPVLARILTDNRLQKTPLGATALACASVNDVTAWILLAMASSVAVAKPGAGVVTVLLVAAYLAVMLLAVRPVVRRLAAKAERHPGALSHGVLAAIMVALLLSATATDAIGIHSLFGAFLMGTFIPHDSRLAHGLQSRLLDTVVVLFLPAFFAYTGMRTQLGLLSSAADWAVCAGIVLVATAGKFGGTLVASRLSGFNWSESAALGALMNTRGLMELIVLNVGVDLGVIGPRLFAMLVFMAVATTLMTNPALKFLLRIGAFGVERVPKSSLRARSG